MPPGSDVAQRTAMKPAFSNDLLDAVLHRANLQQAWKQVRANKGAAGVDGMTIDEFPAWVKAGHWRVVEQSIRSGDYQPAPVRRVEIGKPDGGKRQLGIPTVTDRVIQQAIAQILMLVFAPGFSTDSYGFRPGRNAHQAVRRVQRVLKEGRRFTVDVDLSKFFDRVNHDLLMTHLGRKVRDKRLLGLIARYLRAGIIDNQLYLESREGVPQGGPLSPLLASISHFLEHRLKLTANTTKSRVVRTNDSKFLGFTFKGTQIHWHPDTLRKFKQRIRALTNRNWGVSMHYQLFKVSQYLRGWINYFGIATGYQRCCDLDHWIRRRVRMAYWRQWRKPRTKVRNLMKLGVHVQSAVACGITSKGPWRSSKTPGIQQALSNDYLKAEGLASLRDGWIKLHHSR
jgi:RNA-directed DNA polymerase